MKNAKLISPLTAAGLSRLVVAAWQVHIWRGFRTTWGGLQSVFRNFCHELNVLSIYSLLITAEFGAKSTRSSHFECSEDRIWFVRFNAKIVRCFSNTLAGYCRQSCLISIEPWPDLSPRRHQFALSARFINRWESRQVQKVVRWWFASEIQRQTAATSSSVCSSVCL